MGTGPGMEQEEVDRGIVDILMEEGSVVQRKRRVLHSKEHIKPQKRQRTDTQCVQGSNDCIELQVSS